MIDKAKRAKWRELCEKVDEDVWGQGYQLVAGQFGRGSAGRLSAEDTLRVVEELFPYVQGKLEERAGWSEVGNSALFSRMELGEAVGRLKPNKAPGPDDIPAEAIKVVAKEHPEWLLEVYNNQIRIQSFPMSWKLANLTLIPKPVKDNEPQTYRPIYLINVLGKVYESLIKRSIEDFLEQNNCLSPRQFGFRRGKSGIQAMDVIKRKVAETTCKYMVLLAVDVKNAFNTAPWDGIMRAMEMKEIPEYLRNVVGRYLFDRAIVIKGKT